MSQTRLPRGHVCGKLGCKKTTNVLIVPVPQKGHRALCPSCRSDIFDGESA